MLWTDLFLLWNRISHITHYLLPVNTQKHCISNSLKYHASPNFLYCPIDIITLLSDTPLGVTVSIKKEASSLFTHYWLPILLILFTSLRLRQVITIPTALIRFSGLTRGGRYIKKHYYSTASIKYIREEKSGNSRVSELYPVPAKAGFRAIPASIRVSP